VITWNPAAATDSSLDRHRLVIRLSEAGLVSPTEMDVGHTNKNVGLEIECEERPVV
jgi:hypothetical protein